MSKNFKMLTISIWEKFQQLMMVAVEKGKHQKPLDLAYWQDKVFVKIILYALPLSLITAVPSILIKYLQGYKYVPLIDIGVVLAIGIVVFSRHFSLAFKKGFVAIALTFLSIVLITMLGSFGLGSIYLLSVATYVALLFPKRMVYVSTGTNVFIYIAIAAIIYWKLLDLPVVHAYDIKTWVSYSLNFVFLNIVIAYTISYVLDGIKQTLEEKVHLLAQLEGELSEKDQLNYQLKESEEHYKSLFFLNPSPMWIFDTDTLRILQVNEAAVSKYSYSREEFLDMTFDMLCIPEAVAELLTALKSQIRKEDSLRFVTQHRHRSGEKVFVELRCGTIPVQRKECRLAISRNITKQLNYISAIEEQNSKFREIAFMQSHVIRAPLARIMGLSGLITQNISELPDPQLLSYLDISAQELDQVIQSIINNSAEIFPDGVTNEGHLLDGS
jgi:PAS domain S-box-containing protein